ncbi:hypothetical protein Glove_144g145 [Diversispora epigaea]|uniref:Uncharacterized protein n=1 Tax=Diversispora epigaea TaxID=1348612 RepID=A0A397IUA2_9GLOM|nr:hypothetical protein Glove_144g145 [Diversispora epigaea]
MRVIFAKKEKESVILPTLGNPVKDVRILAFNVNIPLIKKEDDLVNLQKVHPSQVNTLTNSYSQVLTNNCPQVNDQQENYFSTTNNPLQIFILPQMNDFSLTNIVRELTANEEMVAADENWKNWQLVLDTFQYILFKKNGQGLLGLIMVLEHFLYCSIKKNSPT